MPRRRCCGFIDEATICNRFVPRDGSSAEPVVLNLLELEALRLKDGKMLEQAECASVMGLTRPTFQRILHSARNKVALALVEGREIQIEGGNYIVKNRVFECADCKHVWEEPPCTAGGKHGYEIHCPQCGGLKKSKLENGIKHACGGAHQHGDGCGCGHGH